MILLRGAPAASALAERLRSGIGETTAALGRKPALGVIRVGERADDISYERGIRKRFDALGLSVVRTVLPEDTDTQSVIEAVEEYNRRGDIDGILLFRPLPKSMDEGAVISHIAPEKDVDGVSAESLAAVFAGHEDAFAPCTAQAVMELLDYYGIDPEGRKAVVIGRSMVVGRPLSMLLLRKNATVTITHSRSRDLAGICSQADILVAAAGKKKMADASFIGKDAVVIDVGIHEDEGGLCGDVDFASASEAAGALTPVPGGVGAVTTTVLASHVAAAARRRCR